MGPMASRVSLGQARSAQGSRPRHIMSIEFGALWVSLVPLGRTRPQFCSAQGRAQGFTKGSERLFIFRKIQSRGKTATQGSPKAYSRPPPKAHRQGPPKASPKAPPKAPSPKASLGQALGSRKFFSIKYSIYIYILGVLLYMLG